MREIHERVFIGTLHDCRHATPGWAVVHACKHPCHQRAVGYQGNLRGDHPNYLVLETERDLYLNMIDPDRPLFMPPLFHRFLEFAETHWRSGDQLLIHCNQGGSRAPSLAMLFLAKRLGVVDAGSFEEARADFTRLDPSYHPSPGIRIYLSRHWEEFQ